MREIGQIDTSQVVRITDERVLPCLDDATPDIGALWELCVYLEWDRAETVEGIAGWLGPPEGLKILDCACGGGFPAIDLARRGYDMTCSDGSPLMLEYFRRNARRMSVAIEPVNALWAGLSSYFGDSFDVVMCRGGGSLLYAGTWDDDMPPDRSALTEAVHQFVACLHPGGRLYVDITRAENLAIRQPQWTRHPRLSIGDHLVELKERITTDLDRRIRVWHSWLCVDGATYEFERRSHYLTHGELEQLLLQAGLSEVHEAPIQGESYTVFVGRRRPAASPTTR